MRGTKVSIKVKWKGEWYPVHEEYDRVYLVSKGGRRGVQMFSIVKTEIEDEKKVGLK